MLKYVLWKGFCSINFAKIQKIMENTSGNQPNEKNKNSKALLITIIGVLFALNAGLLYMWQKSGNEKEKVEKQKESVVKDNTELKMALADAEHMLNKFRLDSATMADKHKALGAEIITRKNEIAALAAKLRFTQSADKKDIDRLNSMVAELENKIHELEAQNADLKEKNAKLDQEREQLQTQNQEISTKYAQESAEKKKYKSIAQSLKASNLKVEALKKRWLTGKEAVTTRAKDVESIRTTFTIAENNEAEPGDRTIYIKITGPDGITINNPGNEGGTFEFESKESKYTYKISELFDQTAKTVKPSIWRPTGEMKPGKYTIELYCEGFKMGSAALQLK
jgi:regulator of replication initiation timing